MAKWAARGLATVKGKSITVRLEFTTVKPNHDDARKIADILGRREHSSFRLTTLVLMER